MLFMVIERFKNRDGKAVYKRFREKGRMLPEGIKYVGSWTAANQDCCFQLIECNDAGLLQTWVNKWNDLIDFEFIPVLSGQETAKRMSE